VATAKHRFTSAKADGGDASLVRPSNWNAAHDGVYTVANVKDSTYGAVGDGTTDDTTAIQAALTAVGTNGGTIYFPVGRYKITSALTVSRNQKLVGEGSGSSYGGSLTSGPGATIVLSTDAQVGLQVLNPSTVEHSGPVIENLNFHGNTPTARTGIGVYFQNLNNWTIRNCSFRELNVGFDVDGTLDAAWGVVEQCIFKNNLYGIRGLNGFPSRVMGCNIQSVDVAGTYGIYVGRASQCRLIGVKFDGGDVQVYAKGAATTIIGCHFEGALTASLELDGQVVGEDGKSHHVVGCHFNATSAASCIKIDAGVRRPPVFFGNTWTSGVANNILDNSTTGYYRYDDRGQFRMVKGVISSSVAIDHDDSDFVRVDASAGARTITLPTVAGNKASLKGMVRTIIKIDSSANTVTVDGGASETINGLTTQVLNSQWESITFVCDGANWLIISNVHHEDQNILDHTNFPGGSANFLREDGTWASPGTASGSSGFNTAMGHQYVRASGGSDANDGASPNTAKATIAAAHTALPSNGGTIWLSEGTHTISSQVTISKRAVSLIGAGRTATRLKCGTAGIHMIHWTGADGLMMNMSVTDGSGNDFGGSVLGEGLSGVWIDGGQEMGMYHVRFDGFGLSSSTGLSFDSGPAALRILTPVGFADWQVYNDIVFRNCYRGVAASSGNNGAFNNCQFYGEGEERVLIEKRTATGGAGATFHFNNCHFAGSGNASRYAVRIEHGAGSSSPYRMGTTFVHCRWEMSIQTVQLGGCYVNGSEVLFDDSTLSSGSIPTVTCGPDAAGVRFGRYAGPDPLLQVPTGNTGAMRTWVTADDTGTVASGAIATY